MDGTVHPINQPEMSDINWFKIWESTSFLADSFTVFYKCTRIIIVIHLSLPQNKGPAIKPHNIPVDRTLVSSVVNILLPNTSACTFLFHGFPASALVATLKVTPMWFQVTLLLMRHPWCQGLSWLLRNQLDSGVQAALGDIVLPLKSHEDVHSFSLQQWLSMFLIL